MEDKLNIVMASHEEMTRLLKTAQETGQSIQSLVDGFFKITLDTDENPMVELIKNLKELPKSCNDGSADAYVYWEDIEELLKEKD